jgi:pyridinium-3,5-biscarboxylic acid mononucleotide sulfurtransferase
MTERAQQTVGSVTSLSGPACIETDRYAMTPKVEKLYEDLRVIVARYERLAVAFSGGVDSTLLLAVAHDVLGEQVTAFTASSATFPQRELDEATAFCREQGIAQTVFRSEELDVEGFSENPPDRCYLCKQALFGKMSTLASEQGIAIIADGTNVDDDQDYRPGRQAKEEHGVRSPLVEAGFDKRSIRVLSKALGLATYAKQSFACLASRIPYGDTIDRQILGRIDEAEQYLLDRGLTQVRVRVQGDTARIETMPEQFSSLVATVEREQTVAYLKELGFAFVTLDLEGYRTGSMNATLPPDRLK